MERANSDPPAENPGTTVAPDSGTTGEAAPTVARPFLIVTTEDKPGCPAGSAVNRVELDAPMDPWPGHEMVEDDGRDLWTPAPDQVPVPDAVPNSDMRIVLQNEFLPDGRSYFSAADSFLAKQRDDTASLPDDDAAKRAALAAWTQWDMGNQFYRADPLVGALGQMFGLSEADLDAFFRKAARRG